jgi:hypothetical protein
MGTPTGPTQPGTPPPAPPPGTTPPAYGAPPPTGPPPPAGAPPGYGAPPYGAPPYQPPRRSGGIIALVVGGVVLLGAAAVLIFFLTSGRDEPETPPSPVTPTTPAQPTTPVPTTPAPTTPPPSPTTPTSVTLDDLLLPNVGPFELVGVSADPDAVATFGATDALVAEYRRSDGAQMIHNLLAFQSQPDASVARRVFTQVLKDDLGYVEVDQFRRGSLNATLLVGQDDVLVWTNNGLMAVLEGPFGLTAPFFQVLPY